MRDGGFKLGDLQDLQDIKRRIRNRRKKKIRRERRKKWLEDKYGPRRNEKGAS